MTESDYYFILTSKKSGRDYDYPECCIKEFCETPPSKMHRVNKFDAKIRYEAGHLNGTFTGFIPCLNHARRIKRGEITLSELVNPAARRVSLPFPFDWSLT